MGREGFRLTFLLLFNFALSSLSKGDNGCRDVDFLECQSNMTLKDHVIRSLLLPSPAKLDCQHQCFMEKECTSYNLGKELGKLRTCELNDVDDSSDPSDLVASVGSEYCSIKNPCASSPCPAKKACQPDFSWNTYHCKDGKWSPWSTWSECRCFNRTRSRQCKSTSNNQRANDCRGKDAQHERCEHKIDCYMPVGMEDGRISDQQITSSSHHSNAVCHPQNARLNKCCAKAWCAKKSLNGVYTDVYVQVDLGSVMKIYKVSTQGREYASPPQYVTSYKLLYSIDGKAWDSKGITYSANNDRTSVVTNTLNDPLEGRYIRVQVESFSSHPSMRLELYTKV